MEITQFKNLLDKYLAGEASDTEIALLDDALAEGDDGSIFDLYSLSLWNKETHMPAERKAWMKAYMMGHVSASRATASRKRRHTPWLVAASIAAALIVGIFAGLYLTRQSFHPEEYVVTLGNGETGRSTLPDGTTVWLNSATTLRYNSAYNVQNRTVFLDGEAFFEVTANKALPFIVRTDGMAIRALGTKFDVRAYSTDDKILTSLVEGKVQVSTFDEEVTLLPRQEVVFSRAEGKMQKRDVTGIAIPWMDGQIEFDNDGLSQVGKVLERVFAVKVVIEDPSLESITYTGLVRNKSLENVLDLISSTSEVTWKQVDDTIFFRRK